MALFTAFLRAINVGGHTVTMARLRSIFEQSGCSAVESFIASGNLLFETRSRKPEVLERTLEGAMRSALGYDVETFLRSPAEVAFMAAHQPFAPELLAGGGHTLYISMMSTPPPEASIRKLQSLSSELDDFSVTGREMYWLRRSRDSRITGVMLERVFGQKMTARNVNTVRAIAARLSER